MPASDMVAWVTNWRPDPAWVAWRERALNRDDLTVVFTEVGHRHWLRSLEAYFSGQIGHPPLMGATDCHFGRWQLSEGDTRFGTEPRNQELVALHDRIHAISQALVAQYRPENAAQALAGLEALYPLKIELNRKLRALISADGGTV